MQCRCDRNPRIVKTPCLMNRSRASEPKFSRYKYNNNIIVNLYDEVSVSLIFLSRIHNTDLQAILQDVQKGLSVRVGHVTLANLNKESRIAQCTDACFGISSLVTALYIQPSYSPILLQVARCECNNDIYIIFTMIQLHLYIIYRCNPQLAESVEVIMRSLVMNAIKVYNSGGS